MAVQQLGSRLWSLGARCGDAWESLQDARFRIRGPVKLLIFLVVVFLVLYPRPALFIKHVSHLRQVDALADPNDQAVAALSQRFDAHLRMLAHGSQARDGPGPNDPQFAILAVDRFVCREIPYSYDWDNWGVMDYIPTAGEAIARGTEDCDGRAVVATALLRRRGIDARVMGDFQHVWVWTPAGETLHPLPKPVYRVTEKGTVIQWRNIVNLKPVGFAFGAFPLPRQLVIVVAAWFLLLAPGLARSWRLLALGLALHGLFVARAAGQRGRVPDDLGTILGLLELGVAVAVLLWFGWKARRAETALDSRLYSSRLPAAGTEGP
ncbi:MAG TPA: transglutaminase-like domain-containing protein [Phycisphaerae bacterium]|nr:transglutaminase-like domain-containing protein [Phycisphaerae bacterium]HRY69734.1 transglutaminase-like domain-containing protein [Phycisphaerae bacterium]HSA29374.1 transglutaminase-like domain-containing protein [Phycisphaerae bacterium]